MTKEEQGLAAPSLTALDRCDKCGAQAMVKVDGLAGSLYFCGHHYNKHEDALKSFAFSIIDEREIFLGDKGE